MTFREKLRRARSHLFLVAVMLVTAAVVVNIEDDHLASEAGKSTPDHGLTLQRTAN